MIIPTPFAAALLCCSLALATAAYADGLGPEDALRGVDRGQIRPLGQILAAAGVDEQRLRLVEISLVTERSRLVYNVTVLSENGRYRVLKLDAATAKILTEETK